MGRPQKHPTDKILDAAREILLDRGPRAVSVPAVASSLGAPSGSIYYRFPTRDALAIEVWLRAVERFQQGLDAAADEEDAVQAVLACADHVLAWSLANPKDARVLVAHSASGLTSAPWPKPLAARDSAQSGRVRDLLVGLASRIGDTPAVPTVVHFTVVELPFAVVRLAVAKRSASTEHLRALLRSSALAALTTITDEGNDRDHHR